MITVTVEKINGTAIGSANATMGVSSAMLARPCQPLTANTTSSKCKLWVNVWDGCAIVTQEWLVTETYAAVAAALTADVTPSAQVLMPYGTASGTDTYAVTLSPAVTPVSGTEILVKFTNASTGAATLAVNGGSAIAIKKKNGSTAIGSGDIAAATHYKLFYNGTIFIAPNI
jgi:hypothetical protein